MSPGQDSGFSSNRYSVNGGGSYYGSRRSEMYDGYGQPPVAPSSRNRYGRSFSENNRSSYYGNGGEQRERGHPQHNPNQSYDASGSDSTGPWNYSTDPSSENSSLDRANGIMKPSQTPEPMNGYGDNYGGHNRIEEEGGADDYGLPTRRGLPPAPMHSSTPPRQTIQLGGGSSDTTAFSSQGGQLPSAARVAPFWHESTTCIAFHDNRIVKLPVFQGHSFFQIARAFLFLDNTETHERSHTTRKHKRHTAYM